MTRTQLLYGHCMNLTQKKYETKFHTTISLERYILELVWVGTHEFWTFASGHNNKLFTVRT